MKIQNISSIDMILLLKCSAFIIRNYFTKYNLKLITSIVMQPAYLLLYHRWCRCTTVSRHRLTETASLPTDSTVTPPSHPRTLPPRLPRRAPLASRTVASRQCPRRGDAPRLRGQRWGREAARWRGRRVHRWTGRTAPPSTGTTCRVREARGRGSGATTRWGGRCHGRLARSKPDYYASL